MTTTSPTRTLVLERQMPHPAEKIWRALTEGQLIEQWLMANDFQPVVGHRFSFRSTPAPGWDGVIESEVLLVDPPRRLSYRWGSMGLETIVTWTLTPVGDGTLLRMEQSGFAADPSADRFYKGATYGWQNFLGKLENVVGGLA